MVLLHTIMIFLAAFQPPNPLLVTAPQSSPSPRTTSTRESAPAPVTMPRGPVINLSIPLPVYHMTPTAAPRGYLDSIVTTAWPKSSGLQTIVPGQQLGALDGKHLVAYIDETTGDSEVYTDLLDVRPGTVKTSTVTSADSSPLRSS